MSDSAGTVRKMAAALPVIYGAGGVEVVLITSRTTRRYIAPKGAIEAGETPRSCARREALEEAGVIGKISRESVGLLSGSPGEPATIPLYLLRVERVLDDWLEKSERDRVILSPRDAAGLVDDPFLASVLRDLSYDASELAYLRRSSTGKL
jgi:8-oxo-dGTP pyrophosphatase MutT (NUDIX family)